MLITARAKGKIKQIKNHIDSLFVRRLNCLFQQFVIRTLFVLGIFIYN